MTHKKYETPQALANLTSEAGALTKALSQKYLKKAAIRAAKTDCLSLQAKRHELGEEYAALDALLKSLLNNQVTDPEARDRLTNYANLLGIKIMCGAQLLAVDAQTEVSECKIVQPDGSMKPGLRRYGSGEMVSDLREMTIDLAEIVDMGTNILHDMAKASRVWVDANGVSMSPYEEKARAKRTKEDKIPDQPTVGKGMGAVEQDTSENVHLRVAQQYVKTGQAVEAVPESPFAKREENVEAEVEAEAGQEVSTGG